MPYDLLRILRSDEMAGATVPEGLQAGTSRCKMDIAAASGPRHVFPDMDIADIRAFLNQAV